MDSYGGGYFVDEKAVRVENIFLEFLKSFKLDQNSREPFYESEIEAMRPSESNTMFIDFSHVMRFNDVLQKAISDEYLRFYSVIAPGDTIRVIGEFDNQGKCDVNRDKNYLIIHPDVLMSGTRVAASFSCPRRTVLDERLKCSEQSVAALIGTLLHQVFQAGLMREVLTKEFLEEYARIVLQKNIESLYACGGGDL